MEGISNYVKSTELLHISTMGKVCAVLQRMFRAVVGIINTVPGFHSVPLRVLSAVWGYHHYIAMVFSTVEGNHRYCGGYYQ